AIMGFAEGLAWIAQISLFVLLGLLVSPSELPSAIGVAMVVGVVLLLLARPVAVAACVSWFRVGWREQVFLSWAGLRGAVPIVLATIPLSEGVAGARGLFDVVFVLVVVFTLVQGTTLRPLARLLGVAAPGEVTDLAVETAPLERMGADLLQLEIPPGSRLSGVYVDELRLPPGAAVTLVLRNGEGFVPSPQTRLRVGDSLLIVATSRARDATEARLRAISRRGRLARWLGDQGEQSQPVDDSRLRPPVLSDSSLYQGVWRSRAVWQVVPLRYVPYPCHPQECAATRRAPVFDIGAGPRAGAAFFILVPAQLP